MIENDEEYKEVEYEPVKPLSELSNDEILTKIGNAGVVGMGGAGFPEGRAFPEGTRENRIYHCQLCRM